LTCKNEYINEEILKYLIEKGANVNKPDKDGNTPLIISCKSNNDNIVKYLIQNRADISKVNNDGDSPLKIAKEKNNEKIIECINNKIKIDKELFRNRIKSKIQNDSQYKILYKNFNEWKIYNWNQLNDSTICILNLDGTPKQKMFAHTGNINSLVTFSNIVVSLGDEVHLWRDNGTYIGSISGFYTEGIKNAALFFDGTNFHIYFNSKDSSFIDMSYLLENESKVYESHLLKINLSHIEVQALSILSSEFAYSNIPHESQLKPVVLPEKTVKRSLKKTVTNLGIHPENEVSSQTLRSKFSSLIKNSDQFIGAKEKLKKVQSKSDIKKETK